MDIPISAYRPFYSNKRGQWLPGGEPEDAEFFDEMQAIIGGRYKYLIEECRSIQNKDKRSLFKIQRLRAFTISCRCQTWRNNNNIVAHSGLLNIDIDATGNESIEDWPGFRDLICGQKHCVAAFLSASGRGLSFVVRVLPHEHLTAFRSACYDLEKTLGVMADKGTNDVTRLRFTSYDAGGFINPNEFEDIPIYRPTLEYLEQRASKQTLSIYPVGFADSEENYMRAIQRASIDYTFKDGQKHRFLIVVAGWCKRYGMGELFCIQMTEKHFAHLTTADIVIPIANIYKTYAR
jgi:hypothetical protein